MNKITLNCEIITPMFAGSAIPGSCELRPPAIKGALRFWWRALNAHKPWPQIAEEEAKLFGSSDESVGRSKLVISIAPNTLVPTWEELPLRTTPRRIQKKDNPTRKALPIKVLEYLAFGAITQDGYRPYFKASGKFSINIVATEEIDWEPIRRAIVLCSIFGGIGSRTRNGFGKFHIQNVQDIDPISLIKDRTNEKSEFTSISRHSSLFELPKAYGSWDETLCELGKIYMIARVVYEHGIGEKTKNGLEGEHEFRKRIFIGFPLMGDRKSQPLIVNGKEAKEVLRHAKMHFLGVQKVHGKYHGYILHLPYEYLAGTPSELKLSSTDALEFRKACSQYAKEFNNNLLKHGMIQIPL